MPQPIMRLANIGHNHLQSNHAEASENVLSIGVGNDLMKGLAYLESGLLKVGFYNIDTVCHAFEQVLNIQGLSFLGSAEPANLGLFSLPILPKPHLGFPKRRGRNQMWIAG